MKKLTFSFILVLGLIFTFSTSSFSQAVQVADVSMALKSGSYKPKDQIIASATQHLPVLYHQLNQSPIDPVTEKMNMVEITLYKAMISDLNSGKAVETAYRENASTFLGDFPEQGNAFTRKKQILDALHSIVFLN